MIFNNIEYWLFNFSNIEEVVAKFAQLSPQERAKRFVNRFCEV